MYRCSVLFFKATNWFFIYCGDKVPYMYVLLFNDFVSWLVTSNIWINVYPFNSKHDNENYLNLYRRPMSKRRQINPVLIKEFSFMLHKSLTSYRSRSILNLSHPVELYKIRIVRQPTNIANCKATSFRATPGYFRVQFSQSFRLKRWARAGGRGDNSTLILAQVCRRDFSNPPYSCIPDLRNVYLFMYDLFTFATHNC